ncbi:MAG: sulfatase-like hydrolase/transferase [Alphaproteobacteria bacterium]|nr:sulfatase-like hydrolase/transferase [Alphaproteobacteria bacterium]
MSEPANVLFILSDEHTRDVSGCYGHKIVRTPNIDKLAARGTKFTAAYTNCPICVPARASLHTGTYVAENGCWDNAHPYDGTRRSWAHRLRDAGHEAMSIGKLHFRSAKDDNGFTEEVIPLHVVDGQGDLLGLIRRPKAAARGGMPDLAKAAGPGESTYAKYDRNIRDGAIEWLKTRAPALKKPWCLFVSFVKPHFPLIAPPEFFAMYPPESLPRPRLYGPNDYPTHPSVKALRECMSYDDFFTPEKVKIALAAYYGMVSFLDDNIGRVLSALSEAGLAGNTRVIYSTDHGDNLGTRHMWGKSIHYEEAAAIPMIVAGPGVPEGKTCTTPVTLVDVYPTIVQAAGLPFDATEKALPGKSLVDLANAKSDPERVALGEYHAAGSITGMFMIRKGRWKYIHHVGFRPELYDLETDPGETKDLGESAAHAQTLREMEAELRKIVDPDAVNARAFADQEAKIEKFGGRDALIARGDFGYSPAPGEKPVFATRIEA